ncbi:hypothetical protein ACFQI7_24150 [Paenibacillus allorhizosphaerae]|uniref:Uncharacterized protein n=1 Tax=Paenibacillus allorhizosphaerae TaxID=2849866 RepID=A0ABN7TM91_9BACL|nr:hypothetical protein [Paenibacillus allorhizosphaerae]CAG7646776.1 hypothetical protein PAECIP111802_03829 [Paenibacillus allorhizosphaerae]
MDDITVCHGEEKVTVELSLKEAMALAAGIRFNNDPRVAVEARKKVRKTIETMILPETGKIHYQLLEA